VGQLHRDLTGGQPAEFSTYSPTPDIDVPSSCNITAECPEATGPLSSSSKHRSQTGTHPLYTLPTSCFTLLPLVLRPCNNHHQEEAHRPYRVDPTEPFPHHVAFLAHCPLSLALMQTRSSFLFDRTSKGLPQPILNKRGTMTSVRTARGTAADKHWMKHAVSTLYRSQKMFSEVLVDSIAVLAITRPAVNRKRTRRICEL
jgi:hypothetical protein